MTFTECSGADFEAAVRDAWDEGGDESSLAHRILQDISDAMRGDNAELSPLLNAGEEYFAAVKQAKRGFLRACTAAIREQRSINQQLNQKLGLVWSNDEPVINVVSPEALSVALQQVEQWYGGEIENLQFRFHNSRIAFQEECMQYDLKFQETILASYERRGVTRSTLDGAIGGHLPPEGDARLPVVAAYTATLAEVRRMTEAVWRIVTAVPAAWNSATA